MPRLQDKVVIGDVLEAEGRRLADELGSGAVFLRHDVAEELDWAKAVDAAVAMGGLHGMVNNAGIYIPRPVLETDAALFGHRGGGGEGRAVPADRGERLHHRRRSRDRRRRVVVRHRVDRARRRGAGAALLATAPAQFR